MKIVKIDGSIAEQMFQYALYLRFRCAGEDSALHTPKHWIGQIFGIKDAIIASSEEISSQRGSIASKIKALFSTQQSDAKIITDTFGEFSREAVEATEGYYDGSWTSLRYFEPAAEAVSKTFIMPLDSLPAEAQNIAQQMMEALDRTETVAMHIHRPTSAQNTCTTDYYNWAIANIRSYIPDAKFFVFTDEAELVKDRLMLPNDSIFIDTKQMPEATLLQLLLRASHNISANTLLSWWAAWLNPNPDKITIVPQKWTPQGTPHDLLPIYWTAIPTT